MFIRNQFSLFVISVAIAFALLLNGCSSTSDSDSGGDDGNNNDPAPVSFTSGTISPGGTFSYTFTEEGEVEYYCDLHSPDMQGQITVSSSADAVESDTVAMEGTSFNPSSLTVAPNTEVVWINRANVDHTVYSGNPSSSSNDGGGDDGY